MSYTVSYKRVGQIFWKKIKKVTDDGFIMLESARLYPSLKPEWIERDQIKTRYFLTEDKNRYEIPTEGMLFRYSRGRHDIIQGKIDAEKGGAK